MDTDRCVTCGRTKDWKPQVSESPSRPTDLDRFSESSSRPADLNIYAVSPHPAGGQVEQMAHDPSGLHVLFSPNAWTIIQFVTGALACVWAFLHSSPSWSAALFVGGALVCFIALWPVRFLRRDEQLRVRHLVEVTVVNGPGLKLVNPFKACTIVQAETLGMLDYVKLRSTLDGSERVVGGPLLLFLGPYEQVQSRGQGVSLGGTQYVIIEDTQSGQRRVQRGPLMWTPGPREEGKVRNGVKLSSTEYVSVQDTVTGLCRIDKGPCVWFPGPYDEWKQGNSIWLNSTEYVIVQNKSTGEKRVDRGPCTWFPGPSDEWQQGASLSLSRTQYITVIDGLTGRSTLVKGPCIWFPGPYDTPSAVTDAIVLQEDEFVKLKDVATGTRWVQRGKTLLFLEPTWRIENTSTKTDGIQKSWALKGREYLRLQIGPRMRVMKPGHQD